jgi:hypothetical protein
MVKLHENSLRHAMIRYVLSVVLYECSKQPIGLLRLQVNDPGDQSSEALHFAQHCHSRILAHLFQSSTMSHKVQDFHGFTVRIHRCDKMGSIFPPNRALHTELLLPSPSADLIKVTISNLAPYPSLGLIRRLLHGAGVRGIVNIAYSQEEQNKDPRPDRREWRIPFHVIVVLDSLGNAYSMAADEHAHILSSALADLLANDYSPAIIQLPNDLPLPPAHDAPVTLRFLGSEHITTQAQVLRTWQGLDAGRVFAHLQSPAANLPPPSSEASKRSGSPKRHRPDSCSAPTEAPFVPTEQDEHTQAEITRLIHFLYDRYPIETYTYLVNMVDSMQEQIEKDGKISTAENSQDYHFSPRCELRGE